MSTVNGTLSPPAPEQPPESTIASKRKRDDSEGNAHVNGVAASEHTIPDHEPSIDSQLAADIHSILKSFDPEPSILNHVLTKPDDHRLSNGEPSSKRAKVDEISTRSTISQKLEKQHYKTLAELSQDVDDVLDQVLAPIAAKQYSSENKKRVSRQLSDDESKLFARATAFKGELERIVSRQEADLASTPKVPTKGEDSARAADRPTSVQGEPRTVLTLFANAPVPRQLFSSFQSKKQISASDAASSEFENGVGIEMPIHERDLPNVLSTVKVVPRKGKDSDIKAPTFGESFRPPQNTLPLTPPKPVKHLSTRGSSVSFVSQDALSRMSRRGSYNWVRESLSVGQWLGYNGVDSTQEPTSPEAKRKQRDRALSTGEANPPLSQEAVASLQQAREAALFRSVYSSFAPSRDDSTAIVPSEVKGDIWWQKIGKPRFEPDEEVFEFSETNGEVAAPDADDEIDESRIKEALEEYDPVEDHEYIERKLGMHSKEEKEVDEVLAEISELLETLYSFQRIRHASLASNTRTPVNHNSSLTSLTGSPSAPTAGEMAIYETLKMQLSLMIGSLPPYAVAKLNGDQLDELNISRTVLFEAPNHRGVMEEPAPPRNPKVPAYNAAPVGTPVNRGPVSSHYTPLPQTYGRTAVAPNTHARPAANSYYPQQASNATRTPLSQFQRSASNPQAYQTPGTFTQPRPAAYGQNYPPSNVRPNYGPTGVQNYTPAAAQRPPVNQYYQNTPVQNRPYNAQVQPAPYIQRPSSAASMNASASQSPYVRNASPLKPAPVPTVQPTYPQPHPGYATPTPTSTGPLSHLSPRPVNLASPNQPRPNSAVSHQRHVSSSSQSPRMPLPSTLPADATKAPEHLAVQKNHYQQAAKVMPQQQQDMLATANTNPSVGHASPARETATPTVKQGSHTPQPQSQKVAVGGDATVGAAQVNGTSGPAAK
ncbi:hypothetical protein P152DRAFT_515758 [Eremomyces bilateralis CBS 781.70]|uniref:Uncharacterized protein n=1 Tax=Eremomyces bilateralis CBS 781.70 TaxID=1392243 RepID=A0A6G1FXM6_9PEZI|nr:uncharacterized protein P152DRAFT_515758 [Eremomyces bilateralis CBS 781.70]KAF1810587.1 hypothetical protein P152DRAFT_515758 [Eremomyces bilateralis CBS 781.70]